MLSQKQNDEMRNDVPPFSESDLKFLELLEIAIKEKEDMHSDHNDYMQADHERNVSVVPNEEKKKNKVPKMDIENGILSINNSLIKKFLFKGAEIDHCPHKIYHEDIIKDWKRPTTESQLKGIFFETLCIGGGAGDQSVYDLPRNKNGTKSKDQERIELQALIFNKMYPKYHMIICKEGKHKNVQTPICCQWEDPKYKNYVDYTVYLHGTTDIISPISFGNYEYNMAVVDLKLTKDRNGTWGMFSWGDPTNMDHGQAYMYSFITGLPFVYWVWDFVADDEKRGNKFIPVKTIATDKVDPDLINRYNEFHETIRKTIKYLIQYDAEQWPCKSSFDNCKDCSGNPKNNGKCEYVNLIQAV